MLSAALTYIDLFWLSVRDKFSHISLKILNSFSRYATLCTSQSSRQNIKSSMKFVKQVCICPKYARTWNGSVKIFCVLSLIPLSLPYKVFHSRFPFGMLPEQPSQFFTYLYVCGFQPDPENPLPSLKHILLTPYRNVS